MAVFALKPFTLFSDMTFSVTEVADRSHDSLVSVSRNSFEFVKEGGSTDLMESIDNFPFKGTANFIHSRDQFKEVYLLVCMV